MNRFPAKRHNEPGGQRRPKDIAPDVQQEIMIIFSAPFFFFIISYCREECNGPDPEFRIFRLSAIAHFRCMGYNRASKTPDRKGETICRQSYWQRAWASA